jgi:hypothetical protein
LSIGSLAAADNRHTLGADPFLLAGAMPELRDREHPRVARQQRSLGLPGPGDHQTVGVHGGFVGVQRPTLTVHGEPVDFAVNHCHADLVGHPAQVLAPPPVGGRRPTAVDPRGELTGGDQIRLPAVAGHPLVEVGVAARHQRRAIREADVFFRARPQPLRTVGPTTAGLPVSADSDPLDGDHVRCVDTHLAQHVRLGGNGHRLHPGTEHRKRGHVTISSSACVHSVCNAAMSDSSRMSGSERHCVTSTW